MATRAKFARLAPNSRDSRVAQICRGKSHFSRKWPLASVGESSESCIFLKTAILASTRTCQKRQVLHEYSNSLNSRASSHCLVFTIPGQDGSAQEADGCDDGSQDHAVADPKEEGKK